ncbi:hypothetical protein [Plasticicumulans sp.]|uniref:hypothetical protein n=1 Tax=Plasticicumulans sp. TaxID=2307179 RepID=UPI0039383412
MVAHDYNQNRLQQLEAQLHDAYDELHEYEIELRRSGVEDQIKLRRRIRNELTPNLVRLESEYTALLVKSVNEQDLPEAESGRLLAELDSALSEFDPLPTETDTAGIRAKLDEILALLNKPSASSSAKLKMVLPLVPGFLVYEQEAITKHTLREMLRSAKDYFRGKLTKNPR